MLDDNGFARGGSKRRHDSCEWGARSQQVERRNLAAIEAAVDAVPGKLLAGQDDRQAVCTGEIAKATHARERALDAGIERRAGIEIGHDRVDDEQSRRAAEADLAEKAGPPIVVARPRVRHGGAGVCR